MQEQQKPQRELRTAERKARRNAANADRKAGQAQSLSEYARQLDWVAAQNKLPQTVILPDISLNPKATYNEMARGVNLILRRLPLTQQQALAQNVQQSLGKGQGRGVAD
jgi:hypothetical protein